MVQVLHLSFGHIDEAMQAINETVRVAQQSNDPTALGYAVVSGQRRPLLSMPFAAPMGTACTPCTQKIRVATADVDATDS